MGHVADGAHVHPLTNPALAHRRFSPQPPRFAHIAFGPPLQLRLVPPHPLRFSNDNLIGPSKRYAYVLKSHFMPTNLKVKVVGPSIARTGGSAKRQYTH